MTTTRIVVAPTELVAAPARPSAPASTAQGDPPLAHRLPTGTDWIAAVLECDPPSAEQLTNAIGAVMDHLDDVVREHPHIVGAPTSIEGPLLATLADVELGGTATLPVTLPREALEEVFRTVATEPRRDRRHNPGLPPEHVDAIVALSCVTVGVMRRLHLDEITVVSETDHPMEASR